MAEGGLLEAAPGTGGLPPLPERAGLLRPRAEAFHGVVQRPADRRLADDVPAVAGHTLGHVGPAGDHREQLAVLQHGGPVALLEPQDGEAARVESRAAERM